jgi:hypothetical protein
MAKPICVIKVDTVEVNKPLYEIQDEVQATLSDYWVFAVPFEQGKDENFEPIRFQVFYEKDFTKIQYEELKAIINDSINTTKKVEN